MRTVLFRLLGAALLLVLIGGVVWYGVVVPHQRQQRHIAAPEPTPTISDATATSVPPPLGSPTDPVATGAISGGTSTAAVGAGGTSTPAAVGAVYDFTPYVGQCYETQRASDTGQDVTPAARSCDSPHNSVAVGVHKLPAPPGAAFDEASVHAEARQACQAEFDAYIGTRDDLAEVTISPGPEVWGSGGRTVGCLVRRDDGDVIGALTQ